MLACDRFGFDEEMCALWNSLKYHTFRILKDTLKETERKEKEKLINFFKHSLKERGMGLEHSICEPCCLDKV